MARNALQRLVIDPILNGLLWVYDRFDPNDRDAWDGFDGPAYEGNPCTCRPAAVAQHGDHREKCPDCGGSVVYLFRHETDTARGAEDQP